MQTEGNDTGIDQAKAFVWLSWHMIECDSPGIALVRQLLVALLAVVLTCACWIEQIFSSDEVHPCADLKQSNSE